MKSTSDYLQKLKSLKKEIDQADAIVIGAGAGLSTSAGYDYSGERFERYFSDFFDKYGFEDMYSGGFYPFETPEEYWAYWSRYIYINRYLEKEANPVYTELLEIVKDKNYFVITTNVDHLFQKASFNKDRLFYTQGDYGLFQCSNACTPETYDNEEIVLKMVKEQDQMRVPTELLPTCPHCGSPMTMNLRADDTFVQDAGWYEAAKRYQAFIEENQDKKILYLDLGIGGNTPGIIKYPFWRWTLINPEATYACINLDEAIAPKEIEKQSILIGEDIAKVLEDLQKV